MAETKSRRRTTAKDGKPDKPRAAKKSPAKTARRKSGPRAKAPAKRGASKAAEKTAATAKAAGATGKRLNAVKMRLRDSMIVARAAQGWANKLIASEAGVSVKTVERVLSSTARLPSPLEQSPLKVIDDLMMGLAQSVGDFEAMAAAYTELHPSAAVGAKKAANSARGEVAAILQALGHVPDDLRKLRVPLEAAQISAAMVDAVEGFERRMADLPLDDEAKAAVFDAAEGLRSAFAEFIGEEVDGEAVGELPAGAPA